MSGITLGFVTESRKIISHNQSAEVTNGCRKTLINLGYFRKFVIEFNVTWANFGDEKKPSGPVIKICLCDMLGKNFSHTTDFRFIGKKTPYPTANEIANHLIEKLLPIIKERLKLNKPKLRARIKEVEDHF